jgi:hypothetical protein
MTQTVTATSTRTGQTYTYTTKRTPKFCAIVLDPRNGEEWAASWGGMSTCKAKESEYRNSTHPATVEIVEVN